MVKCVTEVTQRLDVDVKPMAPRGRPKQHTRDTRKTN